MDYEQREPTLGILKVVGDRDLLRENTKINSAICMKDHKCRSDVQTLSHQLEAARRNSDYLQEHLLHQRQQSSEFPDQSFGNSTTC